MQIVSAMHEKCAVALGNFDGLHSAHMSVIDDCVKYAKKKGIKSGIILFDVSISEFFKKSGGILTTETEKLKILENSGLDFSYIMHFDKELADTSGDDFINKILADFDVEAFFAGYDYTFGKGAECGVTELESKGKSMGFDVFVTECIKINGQVVSATEIKNCIITGNLDKAELFLGRRYGITGEIVHGLRNGTKLLYPTANMLPEKNKLLPPDGVYMGVAEINGKRYGAAVNIGKNPTFDAEKRTIESYILDFEGDIYGSVITVEFVKLIRECKRFENADALKKQITEDIRFIRDNLK